jgi:trans-aconitate 2-methyltransferase
VACTWHGADYARHSTLQAAMADEVLSRLPLRGDERLLDVGCGDGKLTACMAELLPRAAVLGVDTSADPVAYGQQQFAADA